MTKWWKSNRSSQSRHVRGQNASWTVKNVFSTAMKKDIQKILFPILRFKGFPPNRSSKFCFIDIKMCLMVIGKLVTMVWISDQAIFGTGLARTSSAFPNEKWKPSSSPYQKSKLFLIFFLSVFFLIYYTYNEEDLQLILPNILNSSSLNANLLLHPFAPPLSPSSSSSSSTCSSSSSCRR